jgi:ribosomal protein L7/L12
LTKLFQQKLDLGLKEAKGKTDALLDGETFIFEIETIEQAEELVRKATAIGAVCEIIKDND